MARHLFQTERDGCIRLPPGPAARFSFFNSGRKTFYNDLLENRFLPLLRKGAHLRAKLSSLSLSLSSFSLPDNFVEDTRWIIHIPSMEIWMSRRGDSFTTRNSKGHGIYRDSSTIVKLSFGLKGEEKRMFARHTRYANVRNVKKRFFDFFLPSFFFRESSEEKRVFNNAGNRFRFESFVEGRAGTGEEGFPLRFFPFVFLIGRCSSPSVENKRCQPSSSSACNAITRKVPLNPPWTVNQTGRPAVFNSSTRALYEFIGETELPLE